MENYNLIRKKPDLEKLFRIHSVSKTEKAYLDGLEYKLGQQIIRQVRFGRWLLDGLLATNNIIIEFDGQQNHQSPEKQAKDEKRDDKFLKIGFSIHRLQWFEFERDYRLYQLALKKVVETSANHIKTLIKLQNHKNSLCQKI